MTERTAARPSWECRACDKPWPCDPAREQLAAEMDGLQLSLYLFTCLEVVAGDLPRLPPGEAFDRFIAWTRPSTLAANQ